MSVSKIPSTQADTFWNNNNPSKTLNLYTESDSQGNLIKVVSTVPTIINAAKSLGLS